MEVLPDEALVHIFLYSNVRAIDPVSRVCKRWRRILEDKRVLSLYFQKSFRLTNLMYVKEAAIAFCLAKKKLLGVEYTCNDHAKIDDELFMLGRYQDLICLKHQSKPYYEIYNLFNPEKLVRTLGETSIDSIQSSAYLDQIQLYDVRGDKLFIWDILTGEYSHLDLSSWLKNEEKPNETVIRRFVYKGILISIFEKTISVIEIGIGPDKSAQVKRLRRAVKNICDCFEDEMIELKDLLFTESNVYCLASNRNVPKLAISDYKNTVIEKNVLHRGGHIADARIVEQNGLLYFAKPDHCIDIYLCDGTTYATIPTYKKRERQFVYSSKGASFSKRIGDHLIGKTECDSTEKKQCWNFSVHNFNSPRKRLLGVSNLFKSSNFEVFGNRIIGIAMNDQNEPILRTVQLMSKKS